MQIACLLVVLFAMLVMLGVPKDHQGPHRAHRNGGSQKSHWCRRLPNNFGPLEQNHPALGHSHNKPHKCKSVSHSKYKKVLCYITVIEKKIMTHQLFDGMKSSSGFLQWLLKH